MQKFQTIAGRVSWLVKYFQLCEIKLLRVTSTIYHEMTHPRNPSTAIMSYLIRYYLFHFINDISIGSLSIPPINCLQSPANDSSDNTLCPRIIMRFSEIKMFQAIQRIASPSSIPSPLLHQDGLFCL